MDTAGRWAATVGPQIPLGLMAFFYAPQLTLPKVLLAMNTPASRQQAAAALSQLHAFVTATHNTRFLIDVLALEALLHAAEGNEPAALQALEQALILAQPGGFIRAFVDLGPAMAGLLERLPRQGLAAEYVDRILRAFVSAPPVTLPPSQVRPLPPHQANLVEPLSSRGARAPGTPGAAAERQGDCATPGHCRGDGEAPHREHLPKVGGEQTGRSGRCGHRPGLVACATLIFLITRHNAARVQTPADSSSRLKPTADAVHFQWTFAISLNLSSRPIAPDENLTRTPGADHLITRPAAPQYTFSTHFRHISEPRLHAKLKLFDFVAFAQRIS